METLAQRIARDGPVNELDAIGWAIRLAKRLEALHQLGVAHGSVSPACILTAGQDRNARAYLADVQHTTPTPAYQSPERILGGDISMADDVWALAATLYALLTGQSPFAGNNDGEVRQKIMAASPAPLAVFDVGDDDLQHILDRAFARELPARTSNITSFRRALEEWHPDRGVANLPPLEDEDSTNDDEDVARTFIVRDASSYMQQKLNIQVPNQPAPAPPQQPPMMQQPAQMQQQPAMQQRPQMTRQNTALMGAPAGPPPQHLVQQPAAPLPKANADDDDDDDDNVRTVMRSMPKDDLASMIAKATGGAAPAPAPAAQFGARPAPAAPPSAPGGPAPAPPGFAFGGRPAPAPAPAPAPPDDDDDDDDDNARTMMRSSESYLSGIDAARPQAPAHGPAAPMPAAGRQPLGPPGARATSLGGFQAAAQPPSPVFPQPSAQDPARAFGMAPAPAPAPAPWAASSSNNAASDSDPAPPPTMAFPAFDGAAEPRLGGGTQPMGGPGMEALSNMMAAKPAMGISAPGAAPGMGAPGPGHMGMGGPGMGMGGAPGMGMGPGPMGGPGGPGIPFGGMAPPGDLSALEGPPGGAPLGQPLAPNPAAMMPAPAPAKSSKGLLVVAAIVALLIAAGVTFVILRMRAG